ADLPEPRPETGLGMSESATTSRIGATEQEGSRRLRAGMLRLKGALFDPVTGLYSYHLRLDELRARVEGKPLGLLVLDFPGLDRVESAHGWEVTDRLLRGVAAELGTAVGRLVPASTLVALDGVYGNSFVLFE